MSNLNPQQLEAVTYTQGPILVIAGAGTGKTTVLVERVKYLLSNNYCSSDNILATTFTVKATGEMKQRLQDKGLEVPEWIGTFHSLCSKMVRAHAEKLNIDPNFKLIEGEGQKQVCKRLFGQKSDDILEQINIWKNNCKRPQDVYANHEYRYSYMQYQQVLKEENTLDFGDLIMECCFLLDRFPDVLDKYQQQFKYICIDEFQDTNYAQFWWLRLLTSGQEKPNLFCVGDDDQAIYGWRGSDNKYILNFTTVFPNAKTVKLEENYRSTEGILQAALNVVSRNKERLGKVLRSNKGAGEEVSVHNFIDEVRENEWLIEQLMREKGSVGILVRTTWQVHEIKRLLQQRGIVGATGLQVLLTYLRFINKPTIEHFVQVLQNPKKGVGEKTIEKFLAIAHLKDRDLSFEEMAEMIKELCTREPAKSAVALFIDQLRTWIKNKSELVTVINEIWRCYTLGNTPPLEALRTANKFPILSDFLKYFSLPDVSVMTIHAAKGLEFDSAYLLGWEENIFPHVNSIMTNDIESERRLAYVAITRGKTKVCITHVLSRRSPRGVLRKGVSRFIHEL